MVERRLTLAVAVLTLTLTAVAEARPWAWLGVRIRDMSEQEMEEISAKHGIREGFGVVIVEVMDDTPAARSGLRNGDIVVAVNGRPITETRLLQRLIGATAPDAETRLTVLRQDGRRQVGVRLATMPREIVGERVAAEFGFALRDVGAPEEITGRPAAGAPMVVAVIKGGPAEKSGLRVNDVLLQVGDRAVLTRDMAREALAEVPLDQPLRLSVRREEERITLTISLP
ncbi:MAG TPA: PDZ domain-containing protein [Methylomirabilota bacterium]